MYFIKTLLKHFNGFGLLARKLFAGEGKLLRSSPVSLKPMRREIGASQM